MRSDRAFDAFAREAEPRLRRALLGAVGVERVDDAVAEALGSTDDAPSPRLLTPRAGHSKISVGCTRSNLVDSALRSSAGCTCPSQAPREVDPAANPLVGEPGSARLALAATSPGRAAPAPGGT